MSIMIKIVLGGLCCLMGNVIHAQHANGKNLAPKTALIQLKISRHGDGYSFVVRDVTVINDEKKRPVHVQDQANYPNGLVCFILDKNNAIIDSITIKEPLATRYEYPGEDGTIGSKEVTMDEKDIIIRTVYDPRMESLRISKITGKITRQSLATLKLPNPKM